MERDKMFNIAEPDIPPEKPEKAFREAVIKTLEEILNHKKDKDQLVEYCILQDFGLDIAIFMKWSNDHYTVQFFELKAYAGFRPGGIGISGTQVNILKLENAKIDLLNHFIQWLLVDGTKSKGTERFVIFDNIQAKTAIMGELKEQNNNLRIKDLMKSAITWENLVKELDKILKP